jgi:hypothetical protein
MSYTSENGPASMGLFYCTASNEGDNPMGMYCEISAASPEDIGQFSADPDSLGGLLRGGRTATANSVSLEKAWHGLHYLLTGDVWEGQGPLAFLLAGGEQLGDEEESPVRWFTPDETSQIHRALSGITDDALWSRFDADAMEQQHVYPGIWDEDEADLKEEYLTYFHELKQVVAAAVQSRQGLIVTIG